MSPTILCRQCGKNPVEVSMSSFSMPDGLCDGCREEKSKTAEALQIANDFQDFIRHEDGNYVKKYTKEQVKCALSYLPTSKRHNAWYKEMERYSEKPIEEEKKKREITMGVVTNSKIWAMMEEEYGVSKRMFGKKINFVKNLFKRNIIFRDVAEAWYLAKLKDFSKPAVILAGGVIEELLRLYLESKSIQPMKDDFDGYIKTCENHKLFKSAIHRLSDSIREFRNYVHLKKEVSSRHTISIATAKGAVASIFTIVNDF